MTSLCNGVILPIELLERFVLIAYFYLSAPN